MKSPRHRVVDGAIDDFTAAEIEADSASPSEECEVSSGHPMQAAIETLILALLHQAVSGNFLEQIKLGNGKQFTLYLFTIHIQIGSSCGI